MKGNIEIYINDKLCDLPDDFAINLKRTFYNPSELITKDAWKSYDITFPTTYKNVMIFSFKNVLEVMKKFEALYDATIVVDGVTIFDDQFMLSEIGEDHFKGNFVHVFKKSLKDVLSDRYMNQCGEWNIDFTDYNESIKYYNEKTNSECIFPLVMYGLLPKTPSIKGVYTAKDVYDETVGYKPEAFLPSINCLQAYEKIFEYHGLNISGDAFDDARLNKLYMSYKNPEEYENLWNYGTNAVISIGGEWSNFRNLNTGADGSNEPTTSPNGNPKESGANAVYNTDLLSTINGTVNITDKGGIVTETPIPSGDYPEYTSRSIRIPHSGLYKISLYASFMYELGGKANDVYWQQWGDKGIGYLNPTFYNKNATTGEDAIYKSTIKDRRTEIKIIKSNSDGFELGEVDIDMAYYADVINQLPDNDYPKRFPKGGEVCFIDPQQDKNIICGIGFGKGYDDRYNAYTAQSNESETLKYTNPIALKNGYSEFHEDLTPYTSATASNGYMKASINPDTNKVEYSQSNEFKVNVKSDFNNYSEANTNLMGGKGQVETVVWLTRGDQLTVVHSTDQNRNPFISREGTTMQNVEFNLRLEPFKKDESWLTDKMDDDASYYPDAIIDFDEDSDFATNQINLINFLPSNVKANDWINNFNNAFNLSLTQISDTHYSLNTNKSMVRASGRYIDLTDRASVLQQPTFTPLPVPSVYEVGFTVNEEEQGYIQDKTNGGGTFKTWNTTGTTLKQTSTFSFNWFKDITFNLPNLQGVIPIPIISNREPFDLKTWRDYPTMVEKYYPDLAQRFWYKGDNIVLPNVNGSDVTVSLVKDTLGNEMSLNYYDEYLSVLRNYFTVMTSDETHYTELKCYITHNEFLQMDKSFVILNGDLYFVAGIDQYNPATGYVGSLKLIRKSL